MSVSDTQQPKDGIQSQQEEARQDILDVRVLLPPRRHALIFEQFEALTPGQSFLLVNDHDPKPLFYQLKAEYTDNLIWDYVEQGPTVWRVRVGKGA